VRYPAPPQPLFLRPRGRLDSRVPRAFATRSCAVEPPTRRRPQHRQLFLGNPTPLGDAPAYARPPARPSTAHRAGGTGTVRAAQITRATGPHLTCLALARKRPKAPIRATYPHRQDARAT